MFNHPTNSRANRFNGKLPPADSLIPNKDFTDDAWLRGFRRRGHAKVIGKGPKWRKGSRFEVGKQHRRPLDRNDRARVLHCAEALERRTKHKHKRDGVLGVASRSVQNCTLSRQRRERSTSLA